MRLRRGVDVQARIEDAAVLEADVAFDANAVDQVVEPVDAAQQRRLAAARGADEGRDLLFGDVERDVLERLLLAVPERQILDAQDGVLDRRMGRRIDRDRAGNRRGGGLNLGRHGRQVLPVGFLKRHCPRTCGAGDCAVR